MLIGHWALGIGDGEWDDSNPTSKLLPSRWDCVSDRVASRREGIARSAQTMICIFNLPMRSQKN
ncbi:MAG: hypothetical protein V7K38_08155 [Nostoc sp.]|uniref:hypothetical protein n=1 Tax=Nostoc sp. TaxID=1180 RepID=UPI002FFA63FF